MISSSSPSRTDPVPDTRKAFRTGLVLGGGGLVALVLLVVAISRTDSGAAALTDLLERARPLPLLLSIAIMSVAVVFLALRWRVLVPGDTELPLPGMTGLICAGMLMNVALPGPVGELGAAMLLKRRYGVPTTTGLAAAIHARFLGLATAGGLALLVWSLADLPVPDAAEDLVGAVIVLVAVLALLLGVLSAWPRLLARVSQQTAGRLGALPGLPGRMARQLDVAVTRIAESLGQVGRQPLRVWAQALGWSLASHLSVSTGIWVATVGLGMTAHPGGILMTYCAATAGIVALYALPGVMAGWDALFCAFFAVTTGVGLTDALAITALVRGQQLLLLLLGAGSLAWATRQRRSTG